MPVILTVEDDVDLAQLNARLLRRQGYEVLVANNIAEARILAGEKRLDLLILDIQLPDGDGLSLCRELQMHSDAPVLFLTGMTETEDRITGLMSGGDYYLTKPYEKSEFLAVVQSLLRRAEQTRERIAWASVVTKGSLTLKLNERKAYVNERDALLTSKEFTILAMLVQNEGRELKYDQLYEAVWGVSMNDNPTALRKQISRIKKKLDEENALDFAIFNEHGVGYTFSAV
jgi:DNA-binding response OmpR family regulator